MRDHGTARRTPFSPSDAVSAANKFVAIHSFSANAPTLFGDLKNAESPHDNRSCHGGFICQLPGRSPGAAWTVTRDTHLLPGLQIWVLAPGFAATFWTGFSFQKIFRERFSVVSRTTDETPTSPCPKAIRRRSCNLPFQLEEMSAHSCRSKLFLFYFRPQKPFSLG